MKTTLHYKGHRWTNEEIVSLMASWSKGVSPQDIAKRLRVTPYAVAKMVVRLRLNGIPLERRRKGHVLGRYNTPWTQADVEYLLSRRKQRATMDEIATDLGRTHNAIQGMIQRLQQEGVSVPMYGMGVRRLWDPNTLRAILAGAAPDQ